MIENPNPALFQEPLDRDAASRVELVLGPNIKQLPEFDSLPGSLSAPVGLKVGDNISTDEIMPAGARVLPFRSNIPAISQFVFEQIDNTYPDRVAELPDQGTHAIVAGQNYGQGSSREHAAIAPRFLGLRIVLAKSFARIHWQNLINFGVLPVIFENPADFDAIKPGDSLSIENIRNQIVAKDHVRVVNTTRDHRLTTRHALSRRQIEVLFCGSLVNWVRERDEA